MNGERPSAVSRRGWCKIRDFEWRRIPWTLWVYAAILLWPTAQIEVTAHGPILVRVLFPALIFAWLYFLLDGVRWVWVVSVAIGVLGLVLEVVFGSLDWHD